MENNLKNEYGTCDFIAFYGIENFDAFYIKDSIDRDSLLEKYQFIIEEYSSPYKNTRNHVFLFTAAESKHTTLKRNNWEITNVSSEMTWFNPKTINFNIKDPLGKKEMKSFIFNRHSSLSKGLSLFKKVSNFDSWIEYKEYMAEIEDKLKLIKELESQIECLTKENERLKEKINRATGILQEEDA